MQLRKKEYPIKAEVAVVVLPINNVNILTLLILFHSCFKIYKGNLYICTIS